MAEATRNPYLALLPVGLAVPGLLPVPRWALPHRFTITSHVATLSLLCGAIPWVTPAGHYPAPLFHGVRTFLEARAPRPSDPPRAARLGAWDRRVNGEASRQIIDHCDIRAIKRPVRPWAKSLTK